MFKNDIKMYIGRYKYYFYIFFDPPPMMKNNEPNEVYFDRINPKYGLRFYEAMVAKSLEIDLKYSIPAMEAAIKDKKEREIRKRLLIETAGREQRNLEYFQKYLLRTEALKKA